MGKLLLGIFRDFQCDDYACINGEGYFKKLFFNKVKSSIFSFFTILWMGGWRSNAPKLPEKTEK
jgi:hypothetical protein